jgi:hypothetical protein
MLGRFRRSERTRRCRDHGPSPLRQRMAAAGSSVGHRWNVVLPSLDLGGIVGGRT